MSKENKVELEKELQEKEKIQEVNDNVEVVEEPKNDEPEKDSEEYYDYINYQEKDET